MIEYAKLKVTELKEVLEKRGLPKAGLKAQLVQRLIDADAEEEGQQREQENDASQNESPEQSNDEIATIQGATDHTLASSNLNGDQGRDLSPKAIGKIAKSKSHPVQDATQEPEMEQIPITGPEAIEQPAQIFGEETQSTILPGNLTQLVNVTETQLPTPSQTQTQNISAPPEAALISTQTSISPEDVLEDSKKRKRRSQSPPPSSLSPSQKKLRASPARSDDDTVVQAADRNTNGNAVSDPRSSEVPANSVSPKRSTTAPQDEPRHHEVLGTEKGPSGKKQDSIIRENGKASEPRILPSTDGTDRGKEETETVKAPKTFSHDARFKTLITDPAPTTSSTNDISPSAGTDHDVAPSIHPATSAIYIRELMRPLNPKTVKDHLVILATSPDSVLDPSIISDFFLDSIRTHCLVRFTSMDAAVRVRSALHDRVWPNERDRRALWVDFLPEEKLQKWVEVEQESSSGRGQASKRWEVVYEDEDGEINAYLQETGTGSTGIRTAGPLGKKLNVAGGRSDVLQIEKSNPLPRDDHGRGFQALDDLFRSTRAKPKIYYLPVPKAEVDRRLDLLDAGRGGGGDDEMRRYSFEGDIIVDKGPEFGMRGRGGYRGGRRGGYEGSYRGRGGGYEGDARYRGERYRDEGHSYRRPGY